MVWFAFGYATFARLRLRLLLVTRSTPFVAFACVRYALISHAFTTFDSTVPVCVYHGCRYVLTVTRSAIPRFTTATFRFMRYVLRVLRLRSPYVWFDCTLLFGCSGRCRCLRSLLRSVRSVTLIYAVYVVVTPRVYHLRCLRTLAVCYVTHVPRYVHVLRFTFTTRLFRYVYIAFCVYYTLVYAFGRLRLRI